MVVDFATGQLLWVVVVIQLFVFFDEFAGRLA